METRDVKKLANALAKAQKNGLTGTEVANAEVLQTRLALETKTLKELEQAIKKKKVEEIIRLVNVVANDLGMRDHKLVKEGEKVAKKAAAHSKERSKEVGRVTRALDAAQKSDDLDALLKLSSSDVLRLSMHNGVTKLAMKRKDELLAVKEALGSLEAEIVGLDVQSKAHDGLTEKDILKLSTALSLAKKDKRIPAMHPVVQKADALVSNANKQIKVEREFKAALETNTLSTLAAATRAAQAVGLETDIAKRVFAALKTLEEESGKSTTKVKLVEGTEKERQKETHKREKKIKNAAGKRMLTPRSRWQTRITTISRSST